MRLEKQARFQSEIERISMLLVRYAHPKSSVAFWHTPIDAVFYPFSAYSDYYIDFTAKLRYRGPYDDAGIPMLNYFGRVGTQYNPTAIGQWGLGAWAAYRRGWGHDDARSKFVGAVNWLATNLDIDSKGRGFWFYHFTADGYGLNVSAEAAPWSSGLAQSMGVSVLLRAWMDGCCDEGRDLARAAAKVMIANVETGGLCRYFDGNVVIEEGVVERTQAILDGAIFAIFGLQDYCYLETDDHAAREVLREAVASISRLLPLYDLGNWSRADLYSEDPPMPASLFYHKLHICQLRVLYSMYGDPNFIRYAEKWQRNLDSRVSRYAAIVKKVIFKLGHY